MTQKQHIKGNSTLLPLLAIAVSVLMYIGLSPIRRCNNIDFWSNTLLFTHACEYFIYFAFGIIIKKNFSKFNKMLDNQYFVTFIIAALLSLLYIKSMRSEYDSYIIDKFMTRVSPVILGVLGVVAIINVFKTYSTFFSKETAIGNTLQFIGKRTLDIYLLHYFFIPHLPALNRFFNPSSGVVVEFFITILLAMAVILFCIVISYLLRSSKILGTYIFNAKK